MPLFCGIIYNSFNKGALALEVFIMFHFSFVCEGRCERIESSSVRGAKVRAFNSAVSRGFPFSRIYLHCFHTGLLLSVRRGGRWHDL